MKENEKHRFRYAYATVNKPPPAMNPARPDAGTVRAWRPRTRYTLRLS